MDVADENGQSLKTAGNLRARFEALNMSNDEAGAKPKFRPKRFKVIRGRRASLVRGSGS